MTRVRLAPASELGKLLAREQERRAVSASQIAREIGISPATYYNLISDDLLTATAHEPSISTLEKISRLTGVDVVALLYMVKPNLHRAAQPSAQSMAIARQIDRLRPDQRRILDSFLIAIALGDAKEEA